MGFSRRMLLAGVLAVAGLASACAPKGPVGADGPKGLVVAEIRPGE